MSFNNQAIHKGNIIISLPTNNPGDLQFSRAVILLTDHNREGSIGFILNKPLQQVTLSQLIPSTNGAFTIYEGGPVEQDKLFCIHNRPDLIPNSRHIIEDLYWGGDFDIIFNLVDTGLLTYQNIRFFLGYSGWDGDQLKNELEDNFWIKAEKELDYNNVLSSTSAKYWKKCIAKLGNQYSLWINAPENPTLN